VQHGILLGGNADAFYVTDDGGRNWRAVGPGCFTASIQGLAQTVGFHFSKLQMLSADSGLALAWSSGPDMLAVFRTDDAGGHWSYVVPEVRRSRYADMFFTALNHGTLFFGATRRTSIPA